MGRPLMNDWPLPGRSLTRAVASLRRPVEFGAGVADLLNDMTSGSGAANRRDSRGGACARYGSVRERQGLRRLRGVRMLRAGIDLELLDHGAAQAVLRQHAANGQEEHAIGLGLAHVAERGEG